MKQILLFLLLGLGTGATIAAIAVGIVVTYRGSGFINLAAGAIAMLAGFSFWALPTGELGFTLATPLAIALTYVFVVRRQHRDRARGLPAAAHAPRRWRSSSPRSASCSSSQATMLLAFGTSQHPQPTIIPIRVVRLLDGAVPLSSLVLSGAGRRGHGPALGALPLDALRARHARGVGERGRRAPRRPVAERAVAREHTDRQPPARHASASSPAR